MTEESGVCPECHHEFKPSVGHCRGGQYGGCCRSFRSARDADSHRIGTFTADGPTGLRRCLTEQELVALGWQQEGHYWVSPRTRADRDRIAQHRKEHYA